jgi:hypothetical protein
MCGRRLLIVSAVVVVAAFSLLAGGCGGGSPGVASVASRFSDRSESGPRPWSPP